MSNGKSTNKWITINNIHGIKELSYFIQCFRLKYERLFNINIPKNVVSLLDNFCGALITVNESDKIQTRSGHSGCILKNIKIGNHSKKQNMLIIFGGFTDKNRMYYDDTLCCI